VNQSFRLEDQEQDDGGADRHLLDVGDPLLYCGKHIGQAGRRGLHDLRQMNAVPSSELATDPSPPMVIELTKDSAEALLAANLAGKGNGVFTVEYKDDSYLKGDYVLYFQIQRIGPNNPNTLVRPAPVRVRVPVDRGPLVHR
jgi:hypothetical protein